MTHNTHIHSCVLVLMFHVLTRSAIEASLRPQGRVRSTIDITTESSHHTREGGAFTGGRFKPPFRMKKPV